ncbi:MULTISPECIES: rod shape-determining protein [Lacticaseibacillus]|jgi:rod shape-determining protein MreB|uniref:Cell shape-determining protein MreB n=6 Tax=Lactobacillaceae TaxID=33958 RepID=A0AAN1C818_LACCA|nr:MULTISPECIES: rod shape-determining protein [Lacticaseibacillus]ARY91286.1 rod shape-determining protein [Lacticaseibacillus casei]KAB1968399.1 rod shape-determining protein [Lacticaseibacillus casei]MBI6597117.1 rod shape-determining protein [Lacticaseibacillus casei]MBO1480813.1 rod shape-determining protein [Lacticaseibacillus casei]MBO2416071.1 rod shape-determining protein [Lacticaseibacillus casei]
MAKDIGIDLGTANVLINVKGKGIVLNEPSVVAIDTHTGKVLAVGTEAYKMVGRTPGNIRSIRPLKDGVIADFDITEAMLEYFINKLNVKGVFSKPNILICAPTNITDIEQKAIIQAAEKSGGRHVYLEFEPKVAAVGAGLDIFQPQGNMVIDIGGGTSDIAVLSLGEIVTSRSLRLAGDKMDSSIAAYVKNKHKLIIGEHTAEQIKIKIGAVYDADPKETIEVRGRDIATGLPREVSVTSEEVSDALHETMMAIIDGAKGVLEKTPPELSADIIDRGIMLTGGGALLKGISQLFAAELKVPVLLADDPLDAVALGTGVLLDNIEHHRQY